METTEASGGLNLDKATYTTGGGQPCENCSGPLGEQYWHWQTKAVCEACRGRLTDILTASQSKKAFWRAVLLGSATALGCGIVYALFVHFTGYQLALVTIGIAFLIAKVVRYSSAGVGGRKYQILAVALTYLASAMGYAPAVFSGLNDGDDAKTAATTSGASAHRSSKPIGEGTSSDAPASGGQLVIGFALIFGFILAAPVLAATEAPIGLLIVAFGLWEAWKLSRGLPLSLDGPYRTAAAPATGPPAA